MSDKTDNPTVTLESLLADAGMSLTYRKRLTIAPTVVKALSDGSAQVIVFGKASAGSAAFVEACATIPNVEIMSDTDAEASALRSHVVTYCKTRKFPLLANALRNADNDTVGYVFSRPTT